MYRYRPIDFIFKPIYRSFASVNMSIPFKPCSSIKIQRTLCSLSYLFQYLYRSSGILINNCHQSPIILIVCCSSVLSLFSQNCMFVCSFFFTLFNNSTLIMITFSDHPTIQCNAFTTIHFTLNAYDMETFSAFKLPNNKDANPK